MRTSEEVKRKYFNKDVSQWTSFFTGKKRQIEENIEVYLGIKSTIQDSSGNNLFKQWLFFAFYGMGGKLDKDKKQRFLAHFDREHKTEISEVETIVKEINGNSTNPAYFSFVTKMLNMQNEDFFPIYDSRVASAFFEGEDQRLLENVVQCYNAIKELYDQIDKEDDSIKAFRATFSESEKMGKMRILDFILYNSIEKKR